MSELVLVLGLNRRSPFLIYLPSDSVSLPEAIRLRTFMCLYSLAITDGKLTSIAFTSVLASLIDLPCSVEAPEGKSRAHMPTQ